MKAFLFLAIAVAVQVAGMTLAFSFWGISHEPGTMPFWRFAAGWGSANFLFRAAESIAGDAFKK